MEIKSNLCSNATRKIGLLIVKASELAMDLSGYGFADENCNSGNVYLWLADYPFTLYIGLGSDRIIACWSSPEDGREEFYQLEDCTSLYTLEDWAAYCQREDERIHAVEAE